MREAGESFTTAREINFFLIFASEIHIDIIVNDLAKKGFHEASRGQMEDGKFYLELVLEDIPTEDVINKKIDDIIDLLKNTDGYFDGWGCSVYKD